MHQDLTGTTVAITGGARGIGRATAEAFLAAGAKVAIGDVDADAAAATAADLGAAGRIIGLPLDVTDRDRFAAFLDASEAHLGPLTVLVNNAGIMPTGSFLDEDPEMTQRLLAVNLGAVITGSRLAGQRFVARGFGHIVNIASLAGVSTYPGIVTYCASKHAVVGFTEALQRELHPLGIGVTAVLPGIVRTELSAGTNAARWTEHLTTIDPPDVARAVVRCIGTDQARVTVPRRLAATITAVALLPGPLRRAAERMTGAGTAFTEPDPAARERYHARLAQHQPPIVNTRVLETF